MNRTENAILERGMDDFIKALGRAADKAIDQKVHKKVLEAGARPVVQRAKKAVRRYRRTGAQERSISYKYDSRLGRLRLGWKGKHFYGFFYEVGYSPMRGTIRSKRERNNDGSIMSLHNHRKDALRGARIQRPHLFPARDAELENVFRTMEELLHKEMGGI